jgi:hypothetical protein
VQPRRDAANGGLLASGGLSARTGSLHTYHSAAQMQRPSARQAYTPRDQPVEMAPVTPPRPANRTTANPLSARRLLPEAQQPQAALNPRQVFSNGQRQRTYLVTTYTGVLSPSDVSQPWFCPDLSSSPEQQVDPAVSALVRDKSSHPGSDRATSAHTDASVWIEMTGASGSTQKQRLEQPGCDVFRAGGVDEFPITCADIGEITHVTVMHDNDGYDWNTSRWKLDKIVITCLRYDHSLVLKEGGASKPSARSNEVSQWYGVLADKWIGCTSDESADARIREASRKLQEYHDEIARWEQILAQVRGARISGNLCYVRVECTPPQCSRFYIELTPTHWDTVRRGSRNGPR